MASKVSHEPRKFGEIIVIVGIAALVLVLGVIAMRGFPVGDGNGMSSASSEPQPSPSPTSADPSPTPEPRPTVDPEVTPDTWVPAEQFPGVPAIQPSLEETAPPGEPRITVSDVEAYVASGAADVAGTEEIVSIEFLPADVVEERFHEAPGAYAGRFLCVVELRGSFPIGVPPDVQEELHKAGKKPEVPRMILIFDARTGNLLTSSPRP